MFRFEIAWYRLKEKIYFQPENAGEEIHTLKYDH